MVTDLSKLQSLAMGIVGPPWLTQDIEMGACKSLKKLAIHLYMPEHIRSETENFYESLPPLETLRLQRVMDMTLLQIILNRHGPSLRELLLQPRSASLNDAIKTMVLTSTNIFTLAQFCPQVRELHLVINRSKGDRHETACYEAIGDFPSLEKLSLGLDCSSSVSESSLSSAETTDQSLDEFDKQIYQYMPPYIRKELPHAHIRDALINATVDEKLAESIWDVVTSSQSSLSNGRLLSLRIVPHGGGRVGPSNSMTYELDQMSRSFSVTRGGWGRASDPINVVEIGREEREKRCSKAHSHGCPSLPLTRSS